MVGPTPARERDPTLDVLRGFALLGVLLANLYMLYSLRFATRGGPATGTLDEIAEAFIHLAIANKAQTLLTMLFGFGFAAQLLRAQARGEPAVPIYARRLVALLVIGWLHVLLLAWVDVTWGYSLVGWFLLAFLRCSNRTRVIAAIACVVVPNIIYAFPDVRPALHGLFFDHPRPYYVEQFAAAARGGDWLEIARNNVTLALLWTFGDGVAWYLPWLLGRFLLGYVVGARRWFEGPRVDVFRRLLVIGLAVAVPVVTVRLLQLLDVIQLRGHGAAADTIVAIVFELGLLAQVAAYVAAVVLLMQRPGWRRVLGVLAPVGRMPLTTYLMQSAICPALFYGWGLGWSTPAPAACLGLGLAIFVVQIAIAHLWLRRFRFGPLEWVWRVAVYGPSGLSR